MSRKYSELVNTEPKSRLATNSPLVTAALSFVIIGPTCVPPIAASYKMNWKSYSPLAGLPPSLKRPWYVNAVPSAAVGPIAIGVVRPTAPTLIAEPFSALMSVLLGLSLLLAGATSTLPQMLAISVALTTAGGVAIGYYGLDFFVRPIEIKLL